MTSQLIEQVKLNYKNSLSGKAQKLDEIWTYASDDPGELLSFLHQLAGSAGMYGYDSITEVAADLREKIKASDPSTSYDAEFQELYNLLMEAGKQ